MTTNSTPATQTTTPPVGGFQELDGRRLFVHTSGTGGPAVVFLPGASAIGLDYFGLQQLVAEFSTAVVYDRAGTGFSDDAELPRTGEAVATELRELLAAQGIPGPYVLVAHSLGGAYAHRFAQLYPEDVAGLVWLDAFHREWDALLPAEASLAAGEEMAPSEEQLRQALPFIRDMVGAMFVDFPAEVREAAVDYHVSDRWIQVGIVERASTTALAAELNAGPGMPDVPVVALTPLGVDPVQASLMSAETLQKVHDGKSRLDANLVGQVTHGEQRVLSDTNHSQLITERADAVVAAIRDVVDRAAGA
ncbi:alpha/beta hydrolase [Longispora sp. NPDC051575]|uniref:alpha/beta fold hydrolase n=1 Tax=Longispora sp. NPDC051575 TaxID=3154943 RepID=UPI003449304D